MQETAPQKDLLELASTWVAAKVGRNREEDGTVPGWHGWSRQHSQRDDDIVICRGREEWQQEATKMNKRGISVVSWNILSDTWWKKESAAGVYDHTPAHLGEWSFRRKLLLEWIDKLNPTILCLQEVDYVKFEEDLLPSLREFGYEGEMQKPKKKADKQPCGNATFWKQDKFHLNKRLSTSRCHCVVLDHCCQMIEAEAGFYMPSLCVTNVHLESSQNEVGSTRRAQQLNSALEFAATEAPDAALVVCGDCNTGADAYLFKVLREHDWHGHRFSSVYEHPDTHKTLPVSVATFMVPGHHYVIDHMLYAQESLRLKCALDAFSPQETEEHVHSKGELEAGFPSALCPSDHIPIGAMLELLPQRIEDKKEKVEGEAAVVVSEERQVELREQWKALKSQQPPQPNRKPTPEEHQALSAHKEKVEAWKATAQENAAEVEFVTLLCKGKK